MRFVFNYDRPAFCEFYGFRPFTIFAGLKATSFERWPFFAFKALFFKNHFVLGLNIPILL